MHIKRSDETTHGEKWANLKFHIDENSKKCNYSRMKLAKYETTQIEKYA